MKKVILVVLYATFCIAALSQAPTYISVTGLQRPSLTSLTGTTGGSLSTGTYYYVVTAIDALGNETSYSRGTPVNLTAGNTAVSLVWGTASYAVSYRIYRSTEAYGSSWYLLGSTSSTTYTDNGSAGTLSPPGLLPTAFGIKSNAGIRVSDEDGNNIIKSATVDGHWGNYPAVQIGNHLQLGSSGIYGANTAMIRVLQGVRFEPMDHYLEADYEFRGMLDEPTRIYMRPKLQKISFLDPASVWRTELNQGVEDGSSAIAFKLATWNSLSNTGAKLFSVWNKNAEHFAIMASGEVRAKKITVTQSGWSDYVFHKDYRMPTLPQLEHYIAANKHLPDIPSAANVEKDGINLGDNQALLLRKIEELTLYIIDLDKKEKELAKRNRLLSEKVLRLEKAYERKSK